ncbi:toll-like receptor 6 isoform 1-T6 [Discoglossus pictus]
MARIIFFIFILMYTVFTHCTMYQLIKSNVANYSHQSLNQVPGNLLLHVTVLDLSYNNINQLLISDFNYMPNLKALNASHNKIVDLDSNIFQFNQYLEYIDLSNNQMRNLSGTFPINLYHLDISFNDFKTTAMCKSFRNLLSLEYLAFGATQIVKSDFEAISHLTLQSVYIEMQSLLDYEDGSLLLLNTKKIHLSYPSDLHKYISNIIQNVNITHLTLSHVYVQFSILMHSIQLIWHSSVESLNIYDITIEGPIFGVSLDYSNTSLKDLSVEKVTITDFSFDQGELYRIFADMNIENLAMTDAHLIYMVCPSRPSMFQSLSFVNNALTDNVFQDCETLANLKVLELSGNKLEKLSKVSSMTRHMPSLKKLDISKNHLIYNEEDCKWSESIIWLNMTSCALTNSVFECLPVNIKTLILNNNAISYIPKGLRHMESLEELHLASNRLADLPDCTYFSSLTVLNIESNIILYPSPESIQSCQDLKQIRAGYNQFHCSCEIRHFVNVEKTSPGKLAGWPDSYICENPVSIKGTKLDIFYLPEIHCNSLLLIPIIIVPTLIIFVMILGLCKYFDVPWFLKMIWQWTRTKHRIRSSNINQQLHKGLLYHAFISYSEHDSSWLKNNFLPSVEKDDGSLRICQHERHFIPGKSIIENIVNCIEKSYKSIFILSPHFVQSEWCHYELYFAHHKVFNENSDNLILILLEPIPQYLIPSKYYKLKALMAQRTYLEWPSEKSKQGLFWANLRAAITVNLPDQQIENSSVLSIDT